MYAYIYIITKLAYVIMYSISSAINLSQITHTIIVVHDITTFINCILKLEVKINFEFKKGVGIAIKSKETSS